MKLETFFEKFDQFADAPNAVAKMRELVLEWAVQGRLVPQNPKDETAQALLERFASTAKTRRRGGDESDDTEAPFPIPESWAWVRLPRVLKKLTDGTHHSPPNGPSGEFMYVTAKNIKTDGVLLEGITYVSKAVHDEIYSRCDPSFGDVLYIKDGATTGIATINQVIEPFSMLSSVALLKPSEAIFNRYLLWAMRSPFFYAETRGAMKGAAITRVTLSVMSASLLPLPPLAEQKRIVAKVDELMALCDRLEAQHQERETRHAALARASLARFADAPTPANLPFLFHPSYAIPTADLRKSILTLAVQGKLAPQDPNDEPAEELLERVASALPEKKAENPFLGAIEPLITDESQYELPPGWAWLPLGHVGIWATGCGFPLQYQGETDGEFLFCKVSDMNLPGNEVEIHTTVHKIEADVMKKIRARANPVGTVIFPKIGGAIATHKRRLVIKPTVIDNNCSGIQPIGLTDDSWLLLFLRNLDLTKYQSGTSVPAVGQGSLDPIRIGLPPLAEQRRIVAKVEQLMALVDQLEAQLAESKATAANLLSALVAEITTQA